MRKLTPEQESAKRLAKASYAAYAAAVANKEQAIAEFAARYEEDLEPLRQRWVKDAANADAAKVPVTQIARDILGHKGTVAAYAAIAEGARLSGFIADADAAVQDERIALDGGDLIYTPKPEELAPLLERLGLDPDTAPAFASFRVEDGRVIAVTPRMTEDGMHPVVALVMADGSKHAQALVEYAGRA